MYNDGVKIMLKMLYLLVSISIIKFTFKYCIRITRAAGTGGVVGVRTPLL